MSSPFYFVYFDFGLVTKATTRPQIMAAVTTPTATEEIAVIMWMALNCFFANKYRHAILSAGFIYSFRYHSEGLLK